MQKNCKESYKKDVLRFALFLGEVMMSNGAETHRVEDTIIRICKSRGFNHVNVFTSPTTLIISDERFDGLTFMKTIKNRSIDLNKIVLFNDFSRKFVNNPEITVEEAIKELKEINNNSFIYPDYINYIATGLACACFAFLIGGNTATNFILTTIVSSLGFMCYKRIMKLSSISSFASLVVSIIIAIGGIILTQIGLLSSPTTLIVGSIMPLLSGVSFVKGVRDLISGELISGVARIFDACLIAISIASGVGIILDFWINNGGVL